MIAIAAVVAIVCRPFCKSYTTRSIKSCGIFSSSQILEMILWSALGSFSSSYLYSSFGSCSLPVFFSFPISTWLFCKLGLRYHQVFVIILHTPLRFHTWEDCRSGPYTYWHVVRSLHVHGWYPRRIFEQYSCFISIQVRSSYWPFFFWKGFLLLGH